MVGYRRAILLRHGQTTWNREKRFQGQLDIPLDETGHRQAAAAALLLHCLEAPDVIVSSDLARAAGTADALGRRAGVPVTLDTDLREAHAGRWQGMTHAEILAADPILLHQWRTAVDVRPGGDGETRTEVGARVAGAVKRHLTALPADSVAVFVTHGGAARAAVGHLLGFPAAQWHSLGVMRNCGWAALELDGEGGWRLEVYNTGVPPSGSTALDDPAGAVRDAIV